MKDIKELYLQAKASGRPSDISAYNEAVQDLAKNNPAAYMSSIEYIITSSTGLSTLKPFIESSGLPIPAYQPLVEKLEDCVDECKRQGKDPKKHEEAIEDLKDFKKKYENCFRMFESLNDEREAAKPDGTFLERYVKSYYGKNSNGIQHRKLPAGMISAFGSSAIPDALITANMLGESAVDTMLRVATSYNLQTGHDYEMLMEACKDLDINQDTCKAYKYIQEAAASTIVAELEKRKSAYIRECAIMGKTEAVIEYTEKEIQAIQDLIHHKEYLICCSESADESIRLQKEVYDLYETYKDVLGDPTEEMVSDSVIPELPSAQAEAGSLRLINTRNKFTGKMPDYIARNHDLGYGEDDSRRRRRDPDDDDDEGTSLSDFRRPSADPEPEEDNTPSKVAPEEKEDPAAQAAATNNYYYYTYNNSLNRNQGSFNRDSSSHDDHSVSHKTDDHSRNKRVNSDDNSGDSDSEDHRKDQALRESAADDWDKEVKAFQKLFNLDLNKLGEVKSPEKSVTITIGGKKMKFTSARGYSLSTGKRIERYSDVPTAIHNFNVNKDAITKDEIGIGDALLHYIKLNDKSYGGESIEKCIKKYELKPDRIIFKPCGEIGLIFTSNLDSVHGIGVNIGTDLYVDDGGEAIALESTNFIMELSDDHSEYSFIESSNYYLDEDTYDNHIKKVWFIKSDNGVDNCCVQVDGYAHPMRGRSIMIVLRKKDDEWQALIKHKPTGQWEFPGGGWDRGEQPKDAAIRETNEEAQVNVKNVKRLGTQIQYNSAKFAVSPWIKRHVKDSRDWWYGYYSAIFIGEDDGKFTGFIDEEDFEDTFRWRPISFIAKKLSPKIVNAIEDYIKKTFNESVSADYLSEAVDVKNKKFDKGYKAAFNYENGHLIKITYSLQGCEVTNVGRSKTLRDHFASVAEEWNKEDHRGSKVTKNIRAFLVMMKGIVKFNKYLEKRKKLLTEFLNENIGDIGYLDFQAKNCKIIGIYDLYTGKEIKDEIQIVGVYAGRHLDSGKAKTLSEKDLATVHKKIESGKTRFHVSKHKVGDIEVHPTFMSTYWNDNEDHNTVDISNKVIDSDERDKSTDAGLDNIPDLIGDLEMKGFHVSDDEVLPWLDKYRSRDKWIPDALSLEAKKKKKADPKTESVLFLSDEIDRWARNEIHEGMTSFLTGNYFTESGEGDKFKYAYKAAYDYNTGHALKITYSLDNVVVTDVGDLKPLRDEMLHLFRNYVDTATDGKFGSGVRAAFGALKGLINSKKSIENRKKVITDLLNEHIKEIGYVDFQAKGVEIIDITDRVTGKRINDTVDMVGIYVAADFNKEHSLQLSDYAMSRVKARIEAKNSSFKIIPIKIGDIQTVPTFMTTYWDDHADKGLVNSNGEVIRDDNMDRDNTSLIQTSREWHGFDINSQDKTLTDALADFIDPALDLLMNRNDKKNLQKFEKDDSQDRIDTQKAFVDAIRHLQDLVSDKEYSNSIELMKREEQNRLDEAQKAFDEGDFKLVFDTLQGAKDNARKFQSMVDDLRTQYPRIRSKVDMHAVNRVFREAVGDADYNRPESDHPVRDTLLDIDRQTVKVQQGAKRVAQNVQNVGRAAMKPINRTKDWVTKLVYDWKDADENNIKERLADPHARNNIFSGIAWAIKKGSLFKAGLLLNPIYLYLTLTKKLGKNKKEIRIRNEMLSELKTEMEIIDEKIKDADRNRDQKEKYRLMRFKNEMKKKYLRVADKSHFNKII